MAIGGYLFGEWAVGVGWMGARLWKGGSLCPE